MNNYFPIGILHQSYNLEVFKPPKQARFCKGYRTIEPILSIHPLNYNKPLYFIFVDYNKASFLLKLQAIFMAMDKVKYTNLLNHIYDNITLEVDITKDISIRSRSHLSYSPWHQKRCLRNQIMIIQVLKQMEISPLRGWHCIYQAKFRRKLNWLIYELK